MAERLRKIGQWLSVSIEKVSDHSWAAPRFRGDRQFIFTRGSAYQEPEARATTEFRSNRIVVPKATPWHMSELRPPAALRDGNWMVDLTLERLVDHSRYVNYVDVWVFPRRLRIDAAFQMDRDPNGWHDHDARVLRPMRTGALALALKFDLQSVVITTPTIWRHWNGRFAVNTNGRLSTESAKKVPTAGCAFFRPSFQTRADTCLAYCSSLIYCQTHSASLWTDFGETSCKG